MDNKQPMNTFAMLFPGQGCQTIGMLKSFFKKFSIIKETFDESSEILKYDLWKIVNNGPCDTLNQTEITQPAILSASFAIWKVWKKLSGQNPQFMAGHSLGEYSALVCANSLSFSDAIKIVALRGKFMQESVNNKVCATSAIIGLSEKIINSICNQFSDFEIVSIANFNSPKQIIISGHKNSVIQVMQKCKIYGAKYVKILPISIPSHSILMKPAAKKLTSILNNTKFYRPKIPIISSINTQVQSDPKQIKKSLSRQIYSPILWNQTIHYMINKKVYEFLEVGPGKILSKLMRDFLNNSKISGISLSDPEIMIQQTKKYKKIIYAI
ncbi:MAG: ACP S-malonyltransferase [Wigglesworthia glossinidia]|nr:ACP S-malonyltransferase [Wigglesworthia glossinidia]